MSSSNKSDEKKIDFLIEAYRQRVQLHNNHTDRMWTRFNYLLVTNVTLAGFSVTILTGQTPFYGELILFSIIGFVISVIWYVLGAQDRYYFEGFRKQVQEIEQEISAELGVTQLKDHLFGSAQKAKTDWLTWRLPGASLSRLPALIPVFVVLIWVVVLSILLIIL
jgi:hypothetical protein